MNKKKKDNHPKVLFLRTKDAEPTSSSGLIETVVNTLMTPETEPDVSPDTVIIQSYTYNGTGDFTEHSFNVPVNTLCDILIVGGGGGGGTDRAGGGGSGALILSIGNILSGTYTINVGNGGLGSTLVTANGVNGVDCDILQNGVAVFRAKGGGGGQSLVVENAFDGGSGGGRVSQFTGLGGNTVNTNIVNGVLTGPTVTSTFGVFGNVGGRNTTPFISPNLNNLDGAGGGGIGQGGSISGALVEVDSQFITNNGGKGGDGLYFATINGVVYNFKNHFGVQGIEDGATGNFFIGGGGGGGDFGIGASGVGGKGGGGGGGEQNFNGVSASGFGSGGGGGGGADMKGGNGSAGIVIIRYVVASPIPEGTPTITHKTLNFAYVAPSITYDFTDFNTFPSWTAEATRIGATFSLNGGFSGPGDDGVYFGGPTVGFFELALPSTHNFMSVRFGNYWSASFVRLLVNGVTVLTAPTNGTITHTQTYTPGTVIRIEEGQATIDGDLLIILSNTNFATNTYTLTATAGTQAQINGGTFQTLSGDYQVNVGETQSSVLALGGQTNPFPATNGSTIAIRYSMTLTTTTQAEAQLPRNIFDFIIPPSSVIHIKKKSYLRVNSVSYHFDEVVSNPHGSNHFDLIKISGIKYNPSTYISSDRNSPIIYAINHGAVNTIQLQTFRLELVPQIIHNLTLEIGDRTNVGLLAIEHMTVGLIIEEDTD